MSEDLDRTLNELGVEYVSVVARLKTLREVVPAGRAHARKRKWLSWTASAVAASLIIAAALAVFFNGPEASCNHASQSSANSRMPYMLAFSASDKDVLEEIKRTQNPDGSWMNDSLTRQNAAVLKKFDGKSIACRKAARYLRFKGIPPLSDSEFRHLEESSVRFSSARLVVYRCSL
ncbi:MAG: hypothetical protein IKC27_08390 [Kiritimatiellae bacterium]|nr:hypothetical protein [Kiritimatiellia bacterium]